MRHWGVEKGSANTLVLPHGSGTISEACVFVCEHNLKSLEPATGLLPPPPPLLRHLVVVVLFGCVCYLVALSFHAYLKRNSDINSNKRRNVFLKKSIDG